MQLAFLIVPNITAAIRVAFGQWKSGMKGVEGRVIGVKLLWMGYLGVEWVAYGVMVGVACQGE